MNEFWKEEQFAPAFEYAESIIKFHAKSFSLAALFLPREKRWATYSVYAFCRYVDNLIDVERGRSNGELIAELGAIRDELKIAYRSYESQHPIISAFIKSAKIYKIPSEYPLDLIRGVEMDLTLKEYQTFDELYLFCYRVASVVGLMMCPILGISDDKYLKNAEWLGIAMQLTNILRDVKEDKDNGRIYLPIEDLRQFNLSADDVKNENFNENFQKMMQFQVQRAWEYYRKGNDGIPQINKDSRFAIAAASKIYSEILTKIQENRFNPFIGRAFIPKIKKIKILTAEYSKNLIK